MESILLVLSVTLILAAWLSIPVLWALDRWSDNRPISFVNFDMDDDESLD